MPGRRWMTWLVYAVCVLLVVDVLGWATWRVLALERAERAASAEADYAQRERLALWQMDSFVSALIARESARPYFEYHTRYAADLPYDRAWDLDEAHAVARSPLADGTGDPLIRLHYEIEPDGHVTSPQIDTEVLSPGTATLRAGMLLRELESYRSFEPTGEKPAMRVERNEAEKPASVSPGDASGKEEFTDADLRRQLFDLAREGAGRAGRSAWDRGVENDAEKAAAGQGGPAVGVFRPRWLVAPGRDAGLVFERSVRVGADAVRQGIWIDWPALRAELLAIAVRQVPGGRLEPLVDQSEAPSGGAALATIPLRLVSLPRPARLPQWTPIRLTLAVTWAASVTALVAIGLVLRASMGLADRRGRFIAAVTHELRSPLTSFRLSTDLLARADDEDTRRAHIETLRRESRRLGAVVENVLSYAGLQHRRDHRPRAIPVEEILEPLLPVFERRCREAGAILRVEIGAGAAVCVEPGVVEQILSNLIDNACRYGVSDAAGGARGGDESGERPEIRLTVRRGAGGGGLRVVVSDSGPGVPGRERRRIFGAFYRGEGSSRSHRGVGLGLALARGLAREYGGDLRLIDDGPGAAFELILPIVDEGG